MWTRAAHQAYCLEQMGIVRWLAKSTEADVLVQPRPAMPWPLQATFSIDDGVLALEKSEDKAAAKAPVNEGLRNTGFSAAGSHFSSGVASTVANAKRTPAVKDKTVAGLRQELLAETEVIVEDLQPIEELAVAIEVPALVPAGLPTQLQMQVYLIENKLLLMTQVPPAFSMFEEIEGLALKMSQALLKQSVQQWQSSLFSWPSGLTNPYFNQRTDWLLGALQSMIERQLALVDGPVLVVVAGTELQMLIDALPADLPLLTMPRAHIVSLPELYRIPELKRDAWQAMQTLVS